MKEIFHCKCLKNVRFMSNPITCAQKPSHDKISKFTPITHVLPSKFFALIFSWNAGWLYLFIYFFKKLGENELKEGFGFSGI